MALVSAVVLLGAWLRLGSSASGGIRFDDESWYVSDAQLWHRCAKAAMQPGLWAAVVQGDRQAVKTRVQAAGVDFSHRYRKPCQGYTLLGAGAMLVVGEGPRALLVLNAILGTLSVALIYVLARTGLDRRVAVFAAAMLAVSPYHMVYSRSAMADATVVFFLLLGVTLWARGRNSGRWHTLLLILSGVSLGVSVLCHYRVAYAAGLLVLVDLWLTRANRMKTSGSQRDDSYRRWKGTVLIGMGFVAPILAIEVLFLAAKFAAGRFEASVVVPSYLESVGAYLSGLSGRVGVLDGSWLNLPALTAYPGYFAHWHGAALTIAAFAGLALLAMRRFPLVLAPVLVGATLFILGSQRYVVARALSPALPFLCLGAAVAIGVLCSRLVPFEKVRVGVFGALAIVLLAPVLPRAAALRARATDIERACAVLRAQGEGLAAVPLDSRKYSLCLEHDGIEAVSLRGDVGTAPGPADLRRLRDSGVRWVVVDAQPWHFRGAPSGDRVLNWWLRLDALLREEARCIADFPHVSGREWDFLAEAWGPQHAAEMAAAEGGRIRIYELPTWGTPRVSSSTCREDATHQPATGSVR